MSDGYDQPRWDNERDLAGDGTSTESGAVDPTPAASGLETRVEEPPLDDLDVAHENVFTAWPEVSGEDVLPVVDDEPAAAEESGDGDVEASASEAVIDVPPLAVPHTEPDASSLEHAPGELVIPPDFAVLEGRPRGERRAVGVVVARFNGEVTTRLLDSALAELDARGVDRGAITVMPVPGAFELPLAAMALAKTRRFACIVALGCVIRGDTPHFDFVSAEAASGLQLAAIETGVPVSFGVLTLDRADQADSRVDKGAEAVVTALEMADVFANLRAAAAH